jgi:hypothetical protein
MGSTLLSLNFVAISWGTLHVIPVTTMIAMGLLWLCVALPLTVVGTSPLRHSATSLSFVLCYTVW